MNTELEEFAKLVARHVRDASIQSCDRRLKPDARGPIAKRWREAASKGNFEILVNLFIPDIVDDAIFHLLRAVDQGLLNISFSASNGKIVDLPTQGRGELSGWYMGRGWRDIYSKERFIDVLADR